MIRYSSHKDCIGQREIDILYYWGRLEIYYIPSQEIELGIGLGIALCLGLLLLLLLSLLPEFNYSKKVFSGINYRWYNNTVISSLRQ